MWSARGASMMHSQKCIYTLSRMTLTTRHIQNYTSTQSAHTLIQIKWQVKILYVESRDCNLFRRKFTFLFPDVYVRYLDVCCACLHGKSIKIQSISGTHSNETSERLSKRASERKRPKTGNSKCLNRESTQRKYGKV